jgi:D-alanyl-D-alanine carboxypeptidase
MALGREAGWIRRRLAWGVMKKIMMVPLVVALTCGMVGSVAQAETLGLGAPAKTVRVGAPGETSGPGAPAETSELRTLVEGLTGADGAPGALAQVAGRAPITSGVADVVTGAPVDPRSRFRIGSLTKPFVATVVLQLAAERRIALDAPVERYLPGVVRGADNDGREITVRQLLQHTSGLPNVMDHLSPMTILQDPLRHWGARELVELALPHPRHFRPGQGWAYSNTNYLLAGMIVERVTGRSYGTEIQRRVLVPLGLHNTFVPGDSPAIPGTHPQGYVRPGAELIDITQLNPTVAGAAGGMISSTADLNRFLAALLRGRLLPPAQLHQMLDGRPTGRTSGSKYGLGLEWLPDCGGIWGHAGDMLGFSVRSGATTDGRQATAMINLNPGAGPAVEDAFDTVVPTALCGQ